MQIGKKIVIYEKLFGYEYLYLLPIVINYMKLERRGHSLGHFPNLAQRKASPVIIT